MGKRSRTKGHDWEREVARDLTANSGIKHRRVLRETRDGNQGDVESIGGRFRYQCKVGKRPDIYGALREAVEAADPCEFPAAAIKRDRGPKMVVLPWDVWLNLIALIERQFVSGERIELEEVT